MSTTTAADSQPLFVRKATGLVKGWSAFDASVYCFFAISVVSIGFYTYSLAPFVPGGSLPWALVITTIGVFLQVIVYAVLMSLMPRAGGDYVWQTRILGGGIGFVLASAGWWFAMWHFVPIYANFATSQIFNPLLGIVGGKDIAEWLLTDTGSFVVSIVVLAIASLWVAIGITGYARVQKACLWFGGIGLVVVFLLLLFGSKAGFISAFDREAAQQFGAGANAYQRTLDVGGFKAVGLSFPFTDTMLMIPLVLFANIWVVWGATLAGEVRGAGDFRKNVWAMGAALVAATVISLIFFGLAAKTMGWDFYNAANNAYWGEQYAYLKDAAPLSTYPSPFMLASWMVDSAVVQFAINLLGAFWLLGLIGTVFLSATRVIFAAGFDRILPEPVAAVSSKRRVPWVALLLLVVPGLLVSGFYSYWGNFQTYVLDTALLITVTFLGSAIAAALVPWRAKRIYEASPFASWQVKGVPVITVLGSILAAFFAFNLYHWLKDDVYGVNNRDSLVYLAILYALAIGIYVAARAARKRQGISLGKVYEEIPAE
jgi:APA family basic amino acid/polyamine antiporter